MNDQLFQTANAEDREDAVVAKASAHVHVTPEFLDDPVAFADYVISILRRSEGTILLSIIRED